MLRFSKRKKRLLVLMVVVCSFSLLAGSFALLSNHRIENKYRDRVYSVDAAPPRDVCLILGARVWDGGGPSDILEDRILTGIDLYKRGKVEKLLMSGDHGRKDYDEVNAMKKFALKHGVPEDDIFMDHAGFRTYDSCYRARDVFGVRSMTIVTNEFHLPRALYIANEMGIDAVSVKSDVRQYSAARYNSFREFFARCQAFLDVDVFRPKPRFLGPKIDIFGSGLATQD